jgi:hypothetical protein
MAISIENLLILLKVLTQTDLVGLHNLLSMRRSGRVEKLLYSRRNLEKMAGKIRPLSAGKIHNLGDSLPH